MKTLTLKIRPYIEALYPIIYIHSYEEPKADEIIKELAEDRRVDEWSLISSESIIEFLEPYVLGIESLNNVLIVLKDIHSYLDKSHNDNQRVVAMLKTITHKISKDSDVYANIIIISPVLNIPIELENFIAVFEMDLPQVDEIKETVLKFATNYNEEIKDSEADKLATYLKGLSQNEVDRVLTMVIQDSGFSSNIAKKIILSEKEQIIRKSAVLEMIDTDLTIDSIAGLENLKKWLTQKSKIFRDIENAKKYGVDIPKGIFIVGMPGCGKSLTAKASAVLFDNIPLLRLDIGRLMGKYVGESEANMRKAIAQAEAISPSILWIDEIEKAFSGIGSGNVGNEITTRLFGYFLTWMQEKKSEVYVIATANDISNLPPELLRKGRFDEVFFVDFPNQNEREEIFRVHITSRKKSDIHIKNIDLKELAKNSDGFSGADIETVVKETIEEGFVNSIEVATTDDYLKNIKKVTSISQMIPKQIERYKKFKDEMKLKSASI